MSNVLNSSPEAASLDSIWCEPLKLHFPRVYRLCDKDCIDSNAVVATDRSQLCHACAYTLDVSAALSVEGAVAPIHRMSRGAKTSLIVRHHWSEMLADAYLEGVEDLAATDTVGAVFETESGIFTLAEAPTRESWPGPMLIYVAEIYDDAAPIGALHWEMAISPDGEIRCGDMLHEY
jgi:hypothetical protein